MLYGLRSSASRCVVIAVVAVAGAGQASADPVPLQQISSPNCFTYAPAGWRGTDQNPRGPIFTVASPDGLMASYAGVAINGGQARGMYGPQYRTPETFIGFLMQALTHEPMQQTAATQPWGYYHAVQYGSARYQSYALYYRFRLPATADADPAAYGLMMRLAIGHAGNPQSLAVAGSVAVATLCQGVLQPPPQGYGQYEPPKQTNRPTSRARNDDVTLGGTYNAQLGVGWAHDSAGRNYRVDTTRDYHANGPEGPGYYAKQGNRLQKLTPGMQ
jgi:hypothetical protein